MIISSTNRRRFFTHCALGVSGLLAPGAMAELLTRTPSQTEGPFYPDRLPLDTDNDLLVINDSLTPAVGEVTWLSGRILDTKGDPVRNATVEIWQCDRNGAYLHSGSGQRERRDGNFQGFGRFVTGTNGEYVFRTIKPVAYPGRTPHIHMAVKRRGHDKFVTQCYVRGESGNGRDGVLRSISDPKQRESVVVAFEPLAGSPAGELAARFDVVLGMTPAMP